MRRVTSAKWSSPALKSKFTAAASPSSICVLSMRASRRVRYAFLFSTSSLVPRCRTCELPSRHRSRYVSCRCRSRPAGEHSFRAWRERARRNSRHPFCLIGPHSWPHFDAAVALCSHSLLQSQSQLHSQSSDTPAASAGSTQPLTSQLAPLT